MESSAHSGAARQAPVQHRHPAPPPVTVQPAVARRAARLLVQLRAGTLAAVVAVFCQVMASATLLRVSGTPRLGPVLSNLAAVLVALSCALQWWVWRQAQREWTGRRDVNLLAMVMPSRLVRWLAVACLPVELWAAQQVWQETAAAEAAHWWSLAGALGATLGVVLAAIHPLEPAGPRGVPPHRIDVDRTAARVTSTPGA